MMSYLSGLAKWAGLQPAFSQKEVKKCLNLTVIYSLMHRARHTDKHVSDDRLTLNIPNMYQLFNKPMKTGENWKFGYTQKNRITVFAWLLIHAIHKR